MARGHPGLPLTPTVVLHKSELLAILADVDNNPLSRARVLRLENDFRLKIQTHVGGLPARDAVFDRFNTSPFVILIHTARNNYTKISQIEQDILPAKLFSSMETSAGKMIELVTLQPYDWAPVLSAMHTSYSALDGRKVSGDVLTLATLKSGPRCLNDEMAENFADAILAYAPKWAADAGVQHVEFTYGVLYGTPQRSNKKDWHILRNLYDKLGAANFNLPPHGRWETRFTYQGIDVTATIRIGMDWWDYLGGGRHCAVEVWTALIRASVMPGEADSETQVYQIADLSDIVSLTSVPPDYNVSLLQRSQLPWLFFVARHFADQLLP